jgi:hypothetical protein
LEREANGGFSKIGPFIELDQQIKCTININARHVPISQTFNAIFYNSENESTLNTEVIQQQSFLILYFSISCCTVLFNEYCRQKKAAKQNPSSI